MADTMEWTGRTVEAALEAAAADLGCAPASLEYTVCSSSLPAASSA